MSRIQAKFAALKTQGRKALIPFITAGDPEPGQTLPLMLALVAGGADIIELGVPFSDPMADGPTIQRASERALAYGVSLRIVLGMVREFRKRDADTPVVLMGYANPVEAYGSEAFARDAKAAGVDGALIVDYPPEECAEFAATLKSAGLDPIFLLAPTSVETRFAEVGAMGSGYIYYVSLKGVTGSAAIDLDDVARRIPAIRDKVGLPVGVGFGIRDAESAARIAGVADAVVIGSRLIEIIEQSPPGEAPGRVTEFLGGVRAAMDQKSGVSA
ncbi:MAG: tryptophan synthase subunit alpha [Gammaproteobacteria bacterium]|nr:tryptophan synthase subunit alpha [Gammaproteobacteria bacterium]MBU1646376.1 tryptophan synthase subunit alpha [Gammaproteobacteria bacterium]MBU1970919.1 tryptophan synthase subunit alpha [Gammaproteobacteria bacterium]